MIDMAATYEVLKNLTLGYSVEKNLVKLNGIIIYQIIDLNNPDDVKKMEEFKKAGKL